MVQLRVMIVGTTPAETLLVEDLLQQAGSLKTFRYMGLDQVHERVPDWNEWDLLLARYQEKNSPELLSVLAPVLRLSLPKVIFLVDSYDPLLVTRLLNTGAVHVLPLSELEEVLPPSLSAVFGPDVLPGLAAGRAKDHVSLTQPVTKGLPALLEGEYTRLFQSYPVGISVHRISDGACVECNESFARLLEWPRDELIGRPTLELGLPDDLSARYRNPSVEAPDIEYERRIFTGNRQARYIRVQLRRIVLDGEIFVLALSQDITEQEQAREKVERLRDEMERTVLIRTGALVAANRELAAEIGRRKDLEDFSNQLNQVIWETPDLVAIYAPDGRMQFLNRAGRKMFGLSENAPIDHLDLYSSYSEEMRRRVQEEILPVVARDGIWRGETEFLLPDGRQVPLSQVFLCQKTAAGVVQYYGAVSRDVSDFKLVEKMLRESRERYRTLAEAAHDLIFMVSKDGRMEYANGYARRALSVTADVVEGMPASKFFPQDFASGHFQMFYEVREIDQPVYTEGPLVRNDEQFWLGTWLVPIHDEEGVLTSILGISRDITEQKKTDEALQRALQNERRLSEMRSNFFSMTSHQFRTPLSTILLSTELLQKYGQKWDEQKRGEHLGRIQEAARRLNAMLEDILVIGRVESGRYVCTPKEFDLIPFCEQTVQEMTLNDRDEHRIEYTHDGIDKLNVYQDPEVLHRVVDNLLSNAIKYSPAKSRVRIHLRQEDQHVLLEVVDQGIGIPERDIKYLFQPFQRGSNAADFPGTGIGLTIIQKSVELMNGTISLKSKEGQGTTFMVRFPSRLEKAAEKVTASLASG